MSQSWETWVEDEFDDAFPAEFPDDELAMRGLKTAPPMGSSHPHVEDWEQTVPDQFTD